MVFRGATLCATRLLRTFLLGAHDPRASERIKLMKHDWNCVLWLEERRSVNPVAVLNTRTVNI